MSASTSTSQQRSMLEAERQWNWFKIGRLLDSEEKSIKFAEEQGLLPKSRICGSHKTKMSLYNENGSIGYFRCQRGSCRSKNRVSRARGTWFENAKLPVQQVLYLVYSFSRKLSYEEAQDEDFGQADTILSTKTIANWYSYCREVIVDDLLNSQEDSEKIGGVGKVVEIDEAKFQSRKYHKDKEPCVEGYWVLGMVEEGSEDFRLEVCDKKVRTAEVLIPLIKKHVLPGTTIHTNSWKPYDCLKDHGFIHKKVNNYDPDNPDDGAHTPKPQWGVVRRSLRTDKGSTSSNFGYSVVEYQWRRLIRKNILHPFEGMLNAIRREYGDKRV